MRYRPGLNQRVPLEERLGEAVVGSRRVDLAVAYAKVSGATRLLAMQPPRGSRVVVGLGFGLTDPFAVDRMADAGLEVLAVPDGAPRETLVVHISAILRWRLEFLAG